MQQVPGERAAINRRKAEALLEYCEARGYAMLHASAVPSARPAG